MRPAVIALGGLAALLLASAATGRALGAKTFGLAVLERARADLSVVEVEHNSSPRIAEYAANFGLTPPLNWCAVATSTWILEAAKRLGVEPPIDGSAVAKNVRDQLIGKGSWTPIEALKASEVRPGDVAVWHRGDPGAWSGHVGVVESVSADGHALNTIEGNSGPQGDRVARMVRGLDDPLLLGVGRLG